MAIDLDTAFSNLLMALKSAAYFEDTGDNMAAFDYYQLSSRLMSEFDDAILEDEWLHAPIIEARLNRTMNNYVRRNYPHEWALALDTCAPVKLHWGVGTLAIIPTLSCNSAHVYSVTLDYESA